MVCCSVIQRDPNLAAAGSGWHFGENLPAALLSPPACGSFRKGLFEPKEDI